MAKHTVVCSIMALVATLPLGPMRHQVQICRWREESQLLDLPIAEQIGLLAELFASIHR
jgi:hypothetical protein